MVTKLEKNRKKVIECMKNDDELKEDKYGNFIYNYDNTLRYTLRYHHKKTVVCKQRKIGKRWVTLLFHYYEDVPKAFLIR